ncbi:helix-turn-helix transcriptional regulator [Leptolyngbya sp. FACHB-261]|nr:helix-turn-helix transcriptional regulator [Leptolyngbya sp. FACHB-261]
MVSSIAAQLRKDLWCQGSSGIAQFRHQTKTSSQNYIEHYITTPGDITMLPWEAAEQIIDKFGFNTVKLHLIFAAHTMQQREPWKSSFTLKASNIVKELGWDRRTDLLLSQKLNEVAKAAYILDCLVVKAVWIESKGKKAADASTPVGRVWNVLIDLHGQLTLGGEINQPGEVYITVQPGLWTQHFLSKAGGTAKEALYQFGWLAQEILKMDPYHDELALRLAIHLATDNRFHPSGRYQVGGLLEVVQPRLIVDMARSDRRRAYDLKQNWDNALKLLTQLGWRIEFDPQTYPELLRPGNDARKPRGYLDKLLMAEVTIRQPSSIPELTTTQAEVLETQELPSISEVTLTSEQIKQGLKAKGWNQAKLAGFLGVSQPFISQLVNGRRAVTLELEARLRQLLPLPN